MKIFYNNLDFKPPKTLPLYYKKAYLESQSHTNLMVMEDESCFISFAIHGETAISIPRSPFGSFFKKKSFDKGNFNRTIEAIENELRSVGITAVEIKHPAVIYRDFVKKELLLDFGYEMAFSDINQHIVLDGRLESKIHKMQQRKLQALRSEGFQFVPIPPSEFSVAYQFLQVCRQAQGLELNISWDLFDDLTQKLPDHYHCFGTYRKGKLSSLCITVIVSDDTVYYYLPATSPFFRNQSPMVMLITGMTDYFHALGYKYFDLGVSSIHGKPQETLKLFKERMGAIESEKPTFIKLL